jgi:porin
MRRPTIFFADNTASVVSLLEAVRPAETSEPFLRASGPACRRNRYHLAYAQKGGVDIIQSSSKDSRERLCGGRFLLFLFVLLLGLLCPITGAFAGEQQPAADAGPYSSDFLTRSTFTGDLGGGRNELSKKGVTFDLNLTQIGQGAVSGGKSSNWEYGARGDFTLAVDTGKLGLWPGGFLTAELEGNFGQAINAKTGALMAVNTSQMFPVTGQDDVCLSALSFTQFLSERFGLFFGKVVTITSTSVDMNEFAHGKGDTRFMNTALNVNPVLLVTVPYSTLAAGMVLLPDKDPKATVMTFSVLNSVGTANATGFDTLNGNKLTCVGEGRVRTDFFGLTGHQLVGVTYSNREFTSLDQSLRFFIENRAIAKTKGSWSAYYNFDQYLYEPGKGSGRGYGVFGRFGASDGNPNPMEFFISLGIGGKGVSERRPNDSFGIGYYYIVIRKPTFTSPVAAQSFLRINENGGEAYYSFALTPWAILTPDIQIVRPVQQDVVEQTGTVIKSNHIETALVLGVRLQLVF